jgi:hypothetical protein
VVVVVVVVPPPAAVASPCQALGAPRRLALVEVDGAVPFQGLLDRRRPGRVDPHDDGREAAAHALGVDAAVLLGDGHAAERGQQAALVPRGVVGGGARAGTGR